jgi:hypothetical protein
MALAVFEPATFVSGGKHTNHDITKATRAKIYSDIICYFVFLLHIFQ